MKNLFFKILLIYSFFSGYYSLSQGNTCQTAYSFGSLPTPAGCGGPTGTGLGATVSHNGTNVGATAANPYTYIPDCGTGTIDMAVGALDVWYSFVATGNSLVLNMTGSLASPNVGVYSGNCTSLSGVGCVIGTTAGAITNFVVEPLTIGQTYYIQVSGNNATSTGTYTLTLNNNNDCSDCLQNSTLTVNPLPVNGTYAAGQSVTFCFKITDYTQVSSNWLHGVQVSWGAGWATTTSNVVTTVPASCSGSGTWAWYPTGIGTVNGTSWGSGFYYDYNSGAAGPSNNYGDYNAQNCDPQFCFTLVADPISACVSGTPLSVTVNTSGDGESGSWTSIACQDDPATTFEAILSCCLPPTMTSTTVTCFGGTNGTATGTLASTSAGPWDYVWLNSAGVEISNVQNSTATSSTISNLPVGTYTLLITDNTGCVASNNVNVIQGPGVTMTDPANQNLCTGSTTSAVNFVATDPAATFAWVNTNTTIGLGATGNGNIPSFTVVNTSAVNDTATITVTPTSSSGCPGIPQTFLIIVKPAPQITISGNTTLCNGQSTALSAAFTPAPVSNQVTFNNGALGDIPNGCNGPVGCTVLPGSTSVTSSGIQPTNLTAGQIVSICFTIKHKLPSELTQLTFTVNGITYTSSNPATAPQIYNASLASLLTQIQAAPSNVPTVFCLPQSFLTLIESTGGLSNTTWSVGIKDPIKAGNNSGDFLDITVIMNNYPTASYTWSPTLGLTGTTSGTTTSSPLTITASPQTTTTYTLSITGTNGCVGTSSITINVFTTIFPQFTQIGPLCQNSSAPVLASTSNNGITGTWTPSTISTTNTGNSTYSFTANSGQCAVDTTMIVNVTTSITPTFNPFGPYCQNSTPATLPTTSNNSITGTWNPPSISTSSLGNQSYTFTSDPNQCAGNTTITVNTTTIQEPTFSNIGPYCQNAVPSSLPTTSLNGILGTWNPPTISTSSAGSTTYIFTPDPSLCADSIAKTIVVNPLITPSFSQIGPLCQNTPSVTLPSVSTNGISGTWSPNVVSTTSPGSGNYTFSPSAGQCANQTQMEISITGLPQFAVSVNSNPSLCNSSDGSILISGLSPAVSFTLTYLDDGVTVGPLNLISLSDGSYVVNNLNVGNYTDFLITIIGCSNTQNGPFLLINPASPNLIITNPNSVCAPNSIDITDTLITQGSTNVTTLSYWTDALATNSLSNPNTISVSGTYYILATNNGCTNLDSVIVSIVQTPSITNPGNQATCASFSLPVIAGSDLSGTQGYFNNSQALGGTSISGPITSSQTVYIYDANGACSDEESFVVTINPLPSATISGGATYCQGDVFSDIVASLTGTPNFTLNYTLDGAAQSQNGSSTSISLGNTAGTYVLVSITDVNCTNSNLSSTQTIVINAIPNSPNAGTDTLYCNNAAPVDLIAQGTGSFTWYADQTLTTVLGTNSTYTPSMNVGTTNYYVTETINGCEGPASMVVVSVEECGIIVPTAFTPDGDQTNDTWTLQNIDQVYPKNVVSIYNRWGNLLYRSEVGEYEINPWDGKFNDQDLPVGSYYFIIDYNDDFTSSKSGIVSIIK